MSMAAMCKRCTPEGVDEDNGESGTPSEHHDRSAGDAKGTIVRKGALLAVAGLLASLGAALPARATTGYTARHSYVSGPLLSTCLNGWWPLGDVPDAGAACFDLRGDESSVSVSVVDELDSRVWVTWDFEADNHVDPPVSVGRGGACGPMLNDIAVPAEATSLVLILESSSDLAGLPSCPSPQATAGHITATFS